MGRGEGKSSEMKRGVQSMGEERSGWRREWREEWGEVGGGGQGCSSITSHSGPGVGFSKTDSERSGLDSISHKSWHVTLMDVGHKASRSDMRRATWRTMGKCECSRLMSTRPGSEEGMMEGRKDGGHREIRGVARGIEKNERAGSRLWKSTFCGNAVTKFTVTLQWFSRQPNLNPCCLECIKYSDPVWER